MPKLSPTALRAAALAAVSVARQALVQSLTGRPGLPFGSTLEWAGDPSDPLVRINHDAGGSPAGPTFEDWQQMRASFARESTLFDVEY